QEVVELIDSLFVLRCLQQVDIDRYRPVVELTEYGEEVMRGQTPLKRVPPTSSALLLKLRGTSRVERREERGKGREERSKSRDGSAPSIGRYDSGVVYGSPSPSPDHPPAPLSSRPVSADPALLDGLSKGCEASYWTRRLLSAGFTIEECVAIRGLPRETIEKHLSGDQ
ncbi:MAG: hypothetical protein GX594_10680, partial [Pirellulaceae bacterium]|nr:hypothetical protein [Pirellulaceae bacterium]